MSPRSLAAPPAEQPIEQKQRTNIYTVMLILSFIAICVACVLLYLELRVYSPDYWKTKGIAKPATASLTAPVLDTAPAAARAFWA